MASCSGKLERDARPGRRDRNTQCLAGAESDTANASLESTSMHCLPFGAVTEGLTLRSGNRSRVGARRRIMRELPVTMHSSPWAKCESSETNVHPARPQAYASVLLPLPDTPQRSTPEFFRPGGTTQA